MNSQAREFAHHSDLTWSFLMQDSGSQYDGNITDVACFVTVALRYVSFTELRLSMVSTERFLVN